METAFGDNESLFNFYDWPGNKGEKIKRTENPKTDNEKLLNLEKDFLENRTEKNWSNLWIYSLKVSVVFARFIYKQRGIYPDEETIKDKALSAVSKVLPRFKDPFYIIDRNLGTQLFWGCRQAIDYETEPLGLRLELEAKKLAQAEKIDFFEAAEIVKRRWEKENPKEKSETENGQLFLDFENGGTRNAEN